MKPEPIPPAAGPTRTVRRRTWTAVLLALCVVGAAPACTPLEAQEPAGPAAKPAGLTAEDLPMNPSAARGRGIYVKWCIGCHGEEGRGDGAAAAMLDPLPRDFQSGRF